VFGKLIDMVDKFLGIFRPLVILKNLVTKPMTLKFPKESLEPVKDYRGRHSLELEKCVGCGICASVCPNNAIEIIEFNGKKHPRIHLGKCCFCGLCSEYCPTGALGMTSQAMISISDKSSAVYGPDRLSQPELSEK
jgi:formate hydrogenlyase subunit 6/NADH:ubiquinone oxidoreductase subunit I